MLFLPFSRVFYVLFTRFSLLADKGTIPAGFGVENQATEQEGGDVGAASGAAAAAGTTGATAATSTQQPTTPWYKTRKWIIIQVIGAILGIVILFVFLFPVVAALAQLIVNRTSVNINTAAIIQPTNESCVCLFVHAVHWFDAPSRFQLNLQGFVSLLITLSLALNAHPCDLSRSPTLVFSTLKFSLLNPSKYVRSLYFPPLRSNHIGGMAEWHKQQHNRGSYWTHVISAAHSQV